MKRTEKIRDLVSKLPEFCSIRSLVNRNLQLFQLTRNLVHLNRIVVWMWSKLVISGILRSRLWNWISCQREVTFGVARYAGRKCGINIGYSFTPIHSDFCCARIMKLLNYHLSPYTIIICNHDATITCINKQSSSRILIPNRILLPSVNCVYTSVVILTFWPLYSTITMTSKWRGNYKKIKW